MPRRPSQSKFGYNLSNYLKGEAKFTVNAFFTPVKAVVRKFRKLPEKAEQIVSLSEDYGSGETSAKIMNKKGYRSKYRLAMAARKARAKKKAEMKI